MKISCGNPLEQILNRIPLSDPNHLSILGHNHCWNTTFECICFLQLVLAIPSSFVIPWTTFPDSCHENKLWQPPCSPFEHDSTTCSKPSFYLWPQSLLEYHFLVYIFPSFDFSHSKFICDSMDHLPG
jgi:hypothetical protein